MNTNPNFNMSLCILFVLATIPCIMGDIDFAGRFTPLSARLMKTGPPPASRYAYNALTARVLQDIIVSQHPKEEANNTHDVIIPFDKLIFTDLTTLPHLDGVHLFFDDGRMFYGRIERVMQGPCDVSSECEAQAKENICCQETQGLDTCYTHVTLADNWQLNIHSNGLELYDENNELVLKHTGEKSCEMRNKNNENGSEEKQDEAVHARRLAVGACSGGGCGAVRVSPYVRNRSSQGPCTFRTGIYGIYDPCNTPAVVASNYADPVTLGLARYKPGGMVLPDRVTFAERNGWI